MTNFQRGYTDGWPDWVPEDVEWIDKKEADRKAIRTFIRGALFGALLATGAFIASAAMAGDSASFSGTGCQLVPVTGQPHIADPATLILDEFTRGTIRIYEWAGA